MDARRLIVALLCALTGVFVLCGASAYAAAPVIAPESESALEVTATTAKLTAEVDPGGAETTYFFEYGPEGSYTTSTPVQGPLPGDNSEHPIGPVTIEGLTPGTKYKYRLVTENTAGTETRPERTLTTQGTGGPPPLPR